MGNIETNATSNSVAEKEEKIQKYNEEVKIFQKYAHLAALKPDTTQIKLEEE